MRPRQARRLADRQERNRNRAGYAPTEWAALPRNDRKHISQSNRPCVICEGPDGPECAACTARHDQAVARSADV